MEINKTINKRFCILGDLDSENGVLSDVLIQSIGKNLVGSKLDLVCLANGGELIFRIANAVKSHGGKVFCISTDFSCKNEMLSRIADEVLLAKDLHDLKMLLFNNIDGLAVIPDNLGTVDILMEYLTWMQRVYSAKSVYIIETTVAAKFLMEMFSMMKKEFFLLESFESRFIKLNSLLDLIPNLQRINLKL